MHPKRIIANRQHLTSDFNARGAKKVAQNTAAAVLDKAVDYERRADDLRTTKTQQIVSSR